MNRKLISLVFVFFSLCCQAQRVKTTYTIIGELQFDFRKFFNDELHSVPYSFFMQKYSLNVFVYTANYAKGMALRTALKPKEEYYKNEIKKIEIRIEVPDSLFGRNPLSVVAELKNLKSNRISYTTKPFFINKPGTDDPNYINLYTFKLDHPIPIGSPEEVGLGITLDYLKAVLDNTTGDGPPLKSTVMDLEGLMKMPADSARLSYTQFRDFSRLLIFLEPYIADSSFMNSEAARLLENTNEIKRRLDSSTINENIIRDREQLLIEEELYSEYKSLNERISNYSKQLQLLLYGKALGRQGQQTEETDPGTNKKPVKSSNLRFSLGPSVLYGLIPLYNVTLVVIDPSGQKFVNFESVSRIHTTLTAGIFWAPAKKTKGPLANSGKNATAIQKPSFTFGLQGTYTVYPGKKQLPSTSPLGLGLAAGWKIKNIAITGAANFKTARQPRQYFIDRYKDQSIIFVPGTLDIKDDSIFVDKTFVALGISILYFLGK